MNAQCSPPFLKSGFHYPSWRPVLTARVDGWPVSITRKHGPSTRLVETRPRQHGLCWRVMETGHPSTRAVNSGSGNRTLDHWVCDTWPVWRRTYGYLPSHIAIYHCPLAGTKLYCLVPEVHAQLWLCLSTVCESLSDKLSNLKLTNYNCRHVTFSVCWRSTLDHSYTSLTTLSMDSFLL